MDRNYQKLVYMAADISLAMQPFLLKLEEAGVNQEKIDEFSTNGVDVCIGCVLENTDPNSSLQDLFETVTGSTETLLDGSAVQ
jgi:hypothetical protein